MLCEKCGVWEVAVGETFCGWCGEQLISCRLQLSPPRTFVGEVNPVELLIRNTGAQDLRGLVVEPAPPSGVEVTVEDWAGEVGSKQEATVGLLVDTLSLAEGFHSVPIRLTAGGAGSAPAERLNETILEVGPVPEIDLNAQSFEVLLTSDQTATLQTQVKLTKGFGTVELLPPAASAPWLRGVRPARTAAAQPYLDARAKRSLPVEVEFDLAALRELWERGVSEHEGHLLVSFAERPEEHAVPFRVTCHNPPAIDVQETGTTLKEFRAGLGETFTLTIMNRDPRLFNRKQRRGVLEVYKVEIRGEDGSPCDWIVPVNPPNFPLRVASDDSRQLEFVVCSHDGPAARAGHAGVGEYQVEVVISTNVPGESQWQYLFDIAILPLEDFEGILTIDFGTSNTCCALIELKGRKDKRLVPIDEPLTGGPPDEGTTAPSATLYKKQLEDGTREYQIGSGALGLMYQLSESVVVSAKRHLATKTVFHVVFSDSLSAQRLVRKRMAPKEVVSDYLLRVRKYAERKARARIKKLIIAHPARFAIEQIKELEDAARAAFGSDCEISKISEPVGAALDFIVTKEALSRQEYTLMVYDFGGGTTDITLLKVENRAVNGHREVFPAALGATGHPRLGGTDVTELVLQLGLARCREELKGKYVNAGAVELPTEPEKYLDQDSMNRAIALANRAELLRWAEAMKISFSTGLPEDWLKVPEAVHLRAFVGGEIKSESFATQDIGPSEEEMEARLEELLRDGVGMMKNLAEDHRVGQPDIILLAGKSSSLRLVGQLIAQSFPRSQIVQARKLKECVIEGACIKVLHKEAGWVPHINIGHNDTMSFTTSRLGRASKEGEEVTFFKVVGAGWPIPKEGLKERIEGLPRLRRDLSIAIYENVSGQDVFSNNGSWPEQLRLIGNFPLDDLPPEVSEVQLEHAVPWLVISHDLTVSLELKIEGRVGDPIILEIGRPSTY